MICVALETVLDKSSILKRSRKIIGRELDICVPSLGFAIEPGSWFWHKKKISQDKMKQELCRDKGIRLITIYDSCDLQKTPFEDCYIFKSDLSEKRNSDELQALISFLMEEYKLDTTRMKKDFNSLVMEAKRRSRRRGTEKFKKELSRINPNIVVLGEYQRNHDKILCQCMICKYEWDGTPSGLLSGQGCPKCGGALKKTHQEFVDQVKNLDSQIEIIGEYVNDRMPVKCRCRQCGHEWSPAATSLIQHHGCPLCARKKASAKITRTHEQFVEDMSVRNPQIEVLGRYINARESILCRCLICLNEWNANPDNLLNRHHGCPECNNSRYKVRCVETGQVFAHTSHASRVTGIAKKDIWSCFVDNQKTAGGFHWEHYNE